MQSTGYPTPAPHTEDSESVRRYGPIGALATLGQRGWSWLPPTIALACGIIAAGEWNALQLAHVVIAAIIVIGLWPALWLALAEADWTAALARWRLWDQGEPLPPFPYAVPGSDADKLVIVLGKFRAWAQQDLLPNHGVALSVILMAPIMAGTLSTVLGAQAVNVTIAALCLPQIVLLLTRGNGQPVPLLRATIEVALPLLLGYSLTHPAPLEVIVVALGYAIAYAGATAHRTWTWNIGQCVVMVMLVLTRHSVGVFGVALCWLPQLLVQSPPTPRRADAWLYISMLIAALTIG